MAVYTTRVSLRKPERVSPDDGVSATLDVQVNNELLDSFVSITLANTFAQPPNPFTGQLIYEQDSGDVKVWTGSAWVLKGSPTAPRGIVASAVSSANLVHNASAVSASTTFTADASRRYMFEGHFQVFASDTGGCNVHGRWRAGSVTLNNTDQFASNGAIAGYNSYANIDETMFLQGTFTPLVNGTITVGVVAADTRANSQLVHSLPWYYTAFTVRDVGPA